MGMNKNKIEIKVYKYDTRFIFMNCHTVVSSLHLQNNKNKKLQKKQHANMQKITFNDTYM